MIEFRQTVRRLCQSRGFTLTVVLTLALGIGGTTAIFSVVNGILIKPLPFPESDRLIALKLTSRHGLSEMNASPAIYFTYRDNNQTFQSVALYSRTTHSITGSGDPEQVQSLRVTYEFLPTLGVVPLLGRAFSQEDDLQGNAKTVMLSHGYWQRHFGGAADVLGNALTVDGEPHSVIGVLPQEFRSPLGSSQTAILVPMQMDRARVVFGAFGQSGVARLKDGVTLDEASADAARMLPIAIETYPPVGFSRESFENEYAPNLRPLKDDIVGDLNEVLWVLLGTLGMLLGVACANAANLQLVRTETRGQELAIRAALGADWRTLARTLFLESALLGLAGGAVGLLIASLALPVLLSASASQLPAVLEVAIDSTVAAFTLAASLASGLLFGLMPVVKYAAPRAAMALGAGGLWRTASRERHRARNSLVVTQVALALILLIASGLMIRTFQALRQVEPGFRAPEQVQTIAISIPERVAPEYDRAIRMHNAIQDRLSEISGVESVGFASMGLPLAGGATGAFWIEDQPAADAVRPQRAWRITSPNFFETLGTPLVAGRTFEWRDHYDARPVAIVSETMARTEWGSPDAALGKRIRMNPTFPWLEIVGVLGDIHHNGLDQPAPDAVYLALNDEIARINGLGRFVSFVIRSERVGTAGFLDDIQAAVWSVNGNLPLAAVQTMGDLYERSMARTSLALVLLAITGAMALLLGLVGIYGVVSYTLSQRTREVGIRKALGAQNTQLKRMLMRQVLLLVVVGVAFGLGGAAALTRLMESLLFGVAALDPITYLLVPTVLLATATLASCLPARRVTRIEPMRALREE